MIHTDIQTYNNKLETNDKAICDALAKLINEQLPETEDKIWHAHPVWFLDGNPVVGYSKQKRGIRLMFWSGADFEEEGLNVLGGKFRDASVFYTCVSGIGLTDLRHWLQKSRQIQWDYKNLIRRKGSLEKLKK